MRKKSDVYFNKAKEICFNNFDKLMHKVVIYSVFSRKSGILCGINRAVDFIKDSASGPLIIKGLKDGNVFEPNEQVLEITGLYHELVNLETEYLGMLSYSGPATNMKNIVKSAGYIPVVDMSARHYPPEVTKYLGWASCLGGAIGTSTRIGYDYAKSEIQKNRLGCNFDLYGTIPHCLNAVCSEEAEKRSLLPSVLSGIYYNKAYPDSYLTLLVDYEGKELEVIKQAVDNLGDKLYAVRLDTHGGRNLNQNFPNYHYKTDNYLLKEDYPKYGLGKGVTIEATQIVRNFLDTQCGEIGKKVKIVVSSGFNEAKVQAFKNSKAPIDVIGTGSWVEPFMQFTSDITFVYENNNFKSRLKCGRKINRNNYIDVLFERM